MAGSVLLERCSHCGCADAARARRLISITTHAGLGWSVMAKVCPRRAGVARRSLLLCGTATVRIDNGQRSTDILSMLLPAQVIPFLSHADEMLRDQAIQYFREAHDPAPLNADLVWEALDKIDPSAGTD